jgi:hypothetical protein
MAKQIAQTITTPSAWIVTPNDKGRKSIKSGKVFLKDKEEFEIELFNPLTVSVLSDIKLNGQSISKTGLVLKPGQRVYLDCFIDDKKKFIFSTYEIDGSLDSLNATQNNGLLEVFFYREDVITLDNWQRRFDRIIVEKHYPYNPYPWCNPYTIYGTTIGNEGYGNTNLTNGIIGTTTTSNAYYSSNNSVNCSYTSDVNAPYGGTTVNNLFSIGNLETGRVEKGEVSKQKFTEVEMDFEKNYISSTIIQILPESRKPVEVKEVFNKKNGEINFKNDPTKKKKSGTSGEWPHQYETNTDGVIELIKKLADLHSAGILTDDEFSEKKTELLSKI